MCVCVGVDVRVWVLGVGGGGHCRPSTAGVSMFYLLFVLALHASTIKNNNNNNFILFANLLNIISLIKK